MTIPRGSVLITRFPHASGGPGKKRPVVVVQSDAYNARLNHVVVAEVTSNLAFASDPAYLLIDVTTPEGKATGLDQTSLVACVHLFTMSLDRLRGIVGSLSAAQIQQLDQCLKVALQLP